VPERKWREVLHSLDVDDDCFYLDLKRPNSLDSYGVDGADARILLTRRLSARRDEHLELPSPPYKEVGRSPTRETHG